jgi:hypothetical protein
MGSRLRWAAVGAAVVIGIPAVRLWGWSALVLAFAPREQAHEGGAAPAPQPEVVGSVLSPPVAPAASGLLALSPRADYRRPPARLAPRPVAPGDPAERARADGPVSLPGAPAPGTWEKVEIVGPFGVGTPAPGVTAAVRGALRSRLAECFEPGAQGRWGTLGSAFSTLSPGERKSVGPAILILEVEEAGAGVRVVDAPVERRGSASDGTLNCAQAVLRGAGLQASSEGKKRFRMRLPLRP